MAAVIGSAKNVTVEAPGQDEAAAEIKLNIGAFGETKTGKSYFAAGFPRPFVMSLAQDRGKETLKLHPNSKNILTYQIPQPPETSTGSVIGDAFNGLVWLRENYAKHDIKTFILDHATGYGEWMVSELSRHGTKPLWGKGEANQWGRVRQEFLNVVHMTQDLPIHCIWIFHSVDLKSGDQVYAREPRLIGSTLDRDLNGSFNLWCYFDRLTMERKPASPESPPTNQYDTFYRMWTKCPPNAFPTFKDGSHYDSILTQGLYSNSFGALDEAFGGRLLK